MQGAPRACSCRCRWRSASRWSPRISCPARSCRCCRSGCCATCVAASRPAAMAGRGPASDRAICVRSRPPRLRAAAGADGPVPLGGRGRLSCRRRGAIIWLAGPAAGHRDLSRRRRRPVPAAAPRPRRHRTSSTPSRSPSRPWRSSSDAAGRTTSDHPGLRGHDPLELPDQRRLSSGAAGRKKRCCGWP